jgi:hypothetical protein
MNARQSIKILVFGFLSAVLFGQHALATGIDTSDPNIPPVPSTYDWPTTSYHGPGLAITLSQMHFNPFTLISRSPSGPNEIENFTATLNGQMAINGSPGQSTNSNGSVSTEAFGKVGNTTGSFNTEMLSMNLSGSNIFGPYLMRESPTLASTGQTSVTSLGGGLYHIDSFFDVFTELSLDGGNTWMPSDTSTHVNLTSPEPGSLILIGLGVFGLSGVTRRRRCWA